MSNDHQFKKCGSSKDVRKCDGFISQSKQAAFCASIVHRNPDITFAYESKISTDIAMYSISPENYSMHKNDRNSEGVFIAINGTLVVAPMPDLNVNCEVIWAGLQFSDC